MCEPTLILTAALSLASTAASQAAASKQAKARNSARSAEAERQRIFEQQQSAQFDDTSQPFNRKDQEAGIDEAAAAREESLVGNLRALDPSSIPIKGSAPKVVGDNLAKELNRSLGEGKDFAGRLARLGATGENQQQNRFGLLRGAQEQNRLGSFSQGSSSILPLEFDAANQKGAGLRTLGSVLGSLGTVTSGVAATGGLNPDELLKRGPGAGPPIRL